MPHRDIDRLSGTNLRQHLNEFKGDRDKEIKYLENVLQRANRFKGEGVISYRTKAKMIDELEKRYDKRMKEQGEDEEHRYIALAGFNERTARNIDNNLLRSHLEKKAREYRERAGKTQSNGYFGTSLSARTATGIVGILGLAGVILGIVFMSRKLTAFTIFSGNSATTNIVGTILFILGVLGLYVYIRRITRPH